jgi:hypothetical protein
VISGKKIIPSVKLGRNNLIELNREADFKIAVNKEFSLIKYKES